MPSFILNHTLKAIQNLLIRLLLLIIHLILQAKLLVLWASHLQVKAHLVKRLHQVKTLQAKLLHQVKAPQAKLHHQALIQTVVLLAALVLLAVVHQAPHQVVAPVHLLAALAHHLVVPRTPLVAVLLVHQIHLVVALQALQVHQAPLAVNQAVAPLVVLQVVRPVAHKVVVHQVAVVLQAAHPVVLPVAVLLAVHSQKIQFNQFMRREHIVNSFNIMLTICLSHLPMAIQRF